MHSSDTNDTPASLYKGAMGARWQLMPQVWREVHDVRSTATLQGVAEVTRGTTLRAKLMCWVLGMPPAATAAKLTITRTRKGDRELWHRSFDSHPFPSVLTAAKPGYLHEQIGLIRVLCELGGDDTHVIMRVAGASIFGLPIPKWLLPGTEVREDVQLIGGAPTYHFDISVSHKLACPLVRYRGHLAKTGGGG
jgi:hypothetical protein